MARPVKLYNHSVAPNPRRVRIFAAEKRIELALEEINILAGGATAASGMGNADGGGERRTAACCRRIASASDLRSPSPRKGPS